MLECERLREKERMLWQKDGAWTPWDMMSNHMACHLEWMTLTVAVSKEATPFGNRPRGCWQHKYCSAQCLQCYCTHLCSAATTYPCTHFTWCSCYHAMRCLEIGWIDRFWAWKYCLFEDKAWQYCSSYLETTQSFRFYRSNTVLFNISVLSLNKYSTSRL